MLLHTTQMQLELNQNLSVPRKERQMGGSGRQLGGPCSRSVCGWRGATLLQALAPAFSSMAVLPGHEQPGISFLKWLECEQCFWYEAGKCFILFQSVARTLRKDPLKMKNETCSEKRTHLFMLLIVYCVSEDTKTDNEMHK